MLDRRIVGIVDSRGMVDGRDGRGMVGMVEGWSGWSRDSLAIHYVPASSTMRKLLNSVRRKSDGLLYFPQLEVRCLAYSRKSCVFLMLSPDSARCGGGTRDWIVCPSSSSVVISTDCLSIVELGSEFNGLSVHRRAR